MKDKPMDPDTARLLSLAFDGPLSDRTVFGWPRYQWPPQRENESDGHYADRIERYNDEFYREVARRRRKAGLLKES